MNNILFEKPLVKEYFLSVDFILRKMKEQKRILQCILILHIYDFFCITIDY